MTFNALDARAVTQPGGLYKSLSDGLGQAVTAYARSRAQNQDNDRALSRDDRRARRDQFRQALGAGEQLGVSPSTPDAGYLMDGDRGAIAAALAKHSERREGMRRAEADAHLDRMTQWVDKTGTLPPPEHLASIDPADRELLSAYQSAREQERVAAQAKAARSNLLESTRLVDALAQADVDVTPDQARSAGLDSDALQRAIDKRRSNAREDLTATELRDRRTSAQQEADATGVTTYGTDAKGHGFRKLAPGKTWDDVLRIHRRWGLPGVPEDISLAAPDTGQPGLPQSPTDPPSTFSVDPVQRRADLAASLNSVARSQGSTSGSQLSSVSGAALAGPAQVSDSTNPNPMVSAGVPIFILKASEVQRYASENSITPHAARAILEQRLNTSGRSFQFAPGM